jgi:hypothetical protein
MRLAQCAQAPCDSSIGLRCHGVAVASHGCQWPWAPGGEHSGPAGPPGRTPRRPPAPSQAACGSLPDLGLGRRAGRPGPGAAGRSPSPPSPGHLWPGPATVTVTAPLAAGVTRGPALAALALRLEYTGHCAQRLRSLRSRKATITKQTAFCFKGLLVPVPSPKSTVPVRPSLSGTRRRRRRRYGAAAT